MPAAKPIPVPDALTRPFWGAANEQRLAIQRCAGCERFHHPPVGICPECLSTDLAFREVSGRGRVYSFAVVKDQRLPAFDALMPYPLAYIELDDAPGVVLLTNLPGTPVEQVRTGLPVEVEFEEIVPGTFIPQFHVVAGAEQGSSEGAR